jgi:hypothetical protein
VRTEPFPATTQDTTPVNRHAGALVHIGDVVTQLEAGGLDRGRLGRAITVLLISDIVETAELGVYRVQSACHPTTWYTATSARCDCPDASQRAVACKHSLALVILSAVSATQSRERAEANASARCLVCAQPTDLLDGLCVDCLARDVAADGVDVAAPIPFVLTPRAYAALATAPAPTVDASPTAPQAASQAQHGPSGAAACPRCGRVRGVMFDGQPVRCFGCHRHGGPAVEVPA